MKRFHIQSDLRIVLLYALFGGLWILLSDKLLALVVNDSPTIITISTYKGWFFVAVSAFLIYVLLRGELRTRQIMESELTKSEETYRYLFTNHPHPMWIYDLQTLGFLEINQAAIAKYGYSRDEFLNMAIKDIRPPEELPRLNENLAQPRMELEYSEGWKHRLKDGTIIDVSITSHTIQFNGRNAALVVAQDITERKQAQEKVANSERRFRALIENGADYISLLAADGSLLWESPSDTPMLGYAENEFLGHNILEIVHPDDLSWAQERFAKLASTPGGQDRASFRLLHQDGSWRWVEATVTNLLDEPSVKAIVTNYHDVTERKRAEDILHKSEERYRTTLNEMMEGCQIIDYDWRYVYVNDAAAQQGKKRPDELLMQTMLEAYPGIEDTELFSTLIRCMEDRRPERMENKFVYTDGSFGWFELSIQPVPEGLFILSIDVTERKQAEENLRESEERFRSQYENLPIPTYSWRRIGEDFVLVDYNESAKKITAGHLDKFLQKTAREMYTDRPDVLDDLLNCYTNQITFKHKIQMELRSTGELRELIVSYVYIAPDLVMVYTEDITEQKQAEQNYQNIFENAIEGIFQSTPEGKMLVVNPAAARIYGYASPQEMIDSLTDLAHQIYVNPRDREPFIEQMQTKGEIKYLEELNYRKDGSMIWASKTARAVRDPKGKTLYYEGFVQDITERKRAEEKILQLNRLYATLSQINQTIVRVREPETLFEEICRVGVEYGQFRMAWIGLIDGKDGQVRPVRFAGEEQGYLTDVSINYLDESLGRGPTGTAIREGHCIICKDIATDPRMEPWREQALSRGYRSSASVPFRRQGRIIGALTVYSAASQGFDEDAKNLLDEIGSDISYALDGMDVETQRIQAEESLRRYTFRLEEAEKHARLGNWEFDVTSGQGWWSKQMYRFFSLEVSDVVPDFDTYLERIHPDDVHIVQDVLVKMSRGEEPLSQEYRSNPRYGPMRYFSPTVFTQREANGKAQKFIGTLLDITERKKAEESLRASEQRYHKLFEDMPIAVWEEDFSEAKKYLDALKQQGVTDLRAYFASHPDDLFGCYTKIRLLDVNRAALKMYHAQSKDELIRATNQEMSQLELENLTNDLMAIVEGKSSYTWEGKDQTLTGETIDINLSWSVVPGFEQDFSRVIVTTQDITGSKQAENALRESEERFRSLISQSVDGVVLIDEQGFIIEWNTAEAVITGIPQALAMGAPFWEIQYQILVPEHREKMTVEYLKNAFFKSFQTGAANQLRKPVELEILAVSGERKFIQQTSFLIKTEKGNRVGSIVRDVTSLKQAQKELLESEARFRSLFEDSPVSLWEEDFSQVKKFLDALKQEGVRDFRNYFSTHPDLVHKCAALVKIVDVNNATLKLYNAPDKADLLKPLTDLLYDEPLEQFQDEIVRIAEGQRNFDWNAINKTVDGKLIDVTGRWSAVPGYEDSLEKVILAVMDVTERKKSEQQIQNQLQQLQAFHNVDQAITSNFDLHIVLDTVLKQLVAQLHIDAASVSLFDKYMLSLERVAGVGFYAGTMHGSALRLERSLAGPAVMERRLIHIPNLSQAGNEFANATQFVDEKFISYYAVPLISKGEIKGVIELFHRSGLEADPDSLEFLDSMREQAAIAIDNFRLFDDLQKSNMELSLAYDATIAGWSHAMDLRDKETEGHSQRVTDLTLRLADKMGIRDDEQVQIKRGALLHDIGKLGVPDNILLKPGKLTEEEWVIMRKHPVFAQEMLAPIRYLSTALDIPYCHHEKWDGTGYPRGLKGEQIPLAARIFAIVDVWDALRSDRPYRAAWPEGQVLDYIREQSGKHFDPKIVEIFLDMINSL